MRNVNVETAWAKESSVCPKESDGDWADWAAEQKNAPNTITDRNERDKCMEPKATFSV